MTRMVEVPLEILFADFLILFAFFFYDAGVALALAFLILCLLLKMIHWHRAQFFLTWRLFFYGRAEKRFILFALGNCLVGVLVFLLGLNTLDRELLFILGTTFRAYLAFVGAEVQRKILLQNIEEARTLEEPNFAINLADEDTLRAIQSLGSIKDGLTEAVEERMKVERMKTQLITNISHDLKTPLTSIINYADILSKKTVMDEEAMGYIRILGRNSERLRALIIDLIEASKTGTGNVRVERDFIDFVELVSQIYGDFDGRFQEKNLEFVFEPEEEAMILYADGNILSRIIQNLLSNAMKYSLEHTRVYARAMVSGSRLYFTMKNVSKKKLNISAEELMESFLRADKSRTTEGSGLGLNIAKNLVELLGGNCRLVIDGDFFQVYIELPTEVDEKEE